MTGGKPIPVRLPEDIIRRLDKVKERSGLSHRSDIIKLCVRTFLDHFEAEGEASLPVDWRSILRDQDGRTHRYSIAAEANGHNSTVIINNGTGPKTPYKITKRKKTRS